MRIVLEEEEEGEEGEDEEKEEEEGVEEGGGGRTKEKRRKRDTRASFLCHVRTKQQGSHLQDRKRAITEKQICWHLYPGLPSLQNCNE